MPGPNEKPLDLGTGRVCASFALRTAGWLSFGAPHPRHGFVELAGIPPFDEARRGDVRATRQYREAMTDPANAFLWLEVDGRQPELMADLADPTAPAWRGDGVTVRAEASSVDGGTIRQRWTIRPDGRPVRLTVRGRLDRPALAEVTETDPPPQLGAETLISVVAPDTVSVSAVVLPARVLVSLAGATVEWATRGEAVIGTVTWPDAKAERELVIQCAEEGWPSEMEHDATNDARPDEAIIDRALAYVRGCTALVIEPGERAFLTDHRILPLSWTRDAYWQALLLLAAGGEGDRERVADHLRWLWRRCERPDARWARSHHANGLRKDLPFQADQQLYPMLELADYWRAGGEMPSGVEWARTVPAAWDAMLAEGDPETGLLASRETAADDPAPAPFMSASQVLLWYTASRLGEVASDADIGLEPESLHATADRARSAFGRWFAVDEEPWPYAVDRAEHRVAYHDANDLPIALAPTWGFCRPDDPGWRTTMQFAFSDANPGWVGGGTAGLGSVHTPGAWTLGMVQEWIRARSVADAAGMRQSLTRLEDAAYVDAMLPETIDAEGRRIRQWFAWPGAAIASLLLLDRRGDLEGTLRPARVG